MLVQAIPLNYILKLIDSRILLRGGLESDIIIRFPIEIRILSFHLGLLLREGGPPVK